MESFDVLIVTPAGSANPGPAIAACRAGARGFLDLEYSGEPADSHAALDRLARFVPDGFGVKLGPESGYCCPACSNLLRCREILLAGGEHAELDEWIASCAAGKFVCYSRRSR